MKSVQTVGYPSPFRPMQCIHCGLGRLEHLNETQCLFSPTVFLSRYQHRRNQQNSRNDEPTP